MWEREREYVFVCVCVCVCVQALLELGLISQRDSDVTANEHSYTKPIVTKLIHSNMKGKNRLKQLQRDRKPYKLNKASPISPLQYWFN